MPCWAGIVQTKAAAPKRALVGGAEPCQGSTCPVGGGREQCLASELWDRPWSIPLHTYTHTPCSAHPREAHPFRYPPPAPRTFQTSLPGAPVRPGRQWKPCGPGSISETLVPGCGREPTFWSLVLFSSHSRGLLSDCLWAHLAGAQVPSPEKPRCSWPGPLLHLLLFHNHENDACLSEKMHNV